MDNNSSHRTGSSQIEKLINLAEESGKFSVAITSDIQTVTNVQISNNNNCAEKFHKVSRIVLRHEGGYVNDPNDRGGATNKGISWNTWLTFAKQDLGVEPTLENLKKITDEQAEIIYRKRYWEPKGFCQVVNDRVGLMIYDWTITSGGAGRQIQKLLVDEFEKDIKIDGSIGSGTIKAINSVENQELLLERITSIRKQYYTNLAIRNGKRTSNYKFLRGWLNRVDDCLTTEI